MGNVDVIRLDQVRVWTAEGAHLLWDINWTVGPGQHWALLGPNGAGKSTLLAVASGTRFPSSGTVDLLGGRLGEIEIRTVRQHIGMVDPALRLHEWMTVHDVILTGATGSSRLIPGRYGVADEQKAHDLADLLGLATMSERIVGTCSQGERQRVRLARALMPSPRLLLLDEPASGLDLPAREALLSALSELISAQPELTTVLVSHHLEELPPATSHALLLRRGEVVDTGDAERVLASSAVSACFDVPIDVERRHGRWYARASAAWSPARSSVTSG